jgi:hypothetical protein
MNIRPNLGITTPLIFLAVAGGCGVYTAFFILDFIAQSIIKWAG